MGKSAGDGGGNSRERIRRSASKKITNLGEGVRSKSNGGERVARGYGEKKRKKIREGEDMKNTSSGTYHRVYLELTLRVKATPFRREKVLA